jgi:hypothetical protein
MGSAQSGDANSMFRLKNERVAYKPKISGGQSTGKLENIEITWIHVKAIPKE